MKVIVVEDYEEMSRRAADMIAAEIIHKPNCVLGLATGETPVGTYQLLADMYQDGRLDFSHVTTYNLDEYYGMKPESSESYRYFMNTHLFNLVNIDRKRTFVPEGNEDVETACADYEKVLEKTGGADIQLLGLGRNGHIGFNEPSDSFSVHTHAVKLTESTIEANARLFDNHEEEVPRVAITMGIGNIFKAQKVLLLANGREKADAVYKMLHGPVVPQVPASVLQMHPDCTVIIDKQANTAA